MLKEDSSAIIPVTVRKIFDGNGIVPSEFRVKFRLGDEWETMVVDNAR